MAAVAIESEVVLADGTKVTVVLEAASNADSVEPDACRMLEETLLCGKEVTESAEVTLEEALSVEDGAAGSILVVYTAELEMAVEEGVGFPS